MFNALVKRPGLLAIAISILLLIWLFSGSILRSSEEATPDHDKAEALAPQVEITWMDATPVQREQVLQGQLEAWQRVELRAQIKATVERIDQPKGAVVKAGELLLSLSADSRPMQLSMIEAEMRQREAAAEAARKLRDKKLVSANDLLKVETELANAKALLSEARLGMQYTQIRAPFAGVVDDRMVELGDYVEPKQSLLTLVDISKLKVSAQIPQQQVAAIKLGQLVKVQLLDGEMLQGEVYFISAAADPGSRSFRVEVSVDNPERLRLAGGSATLHIQTGETLAHPLSPALLSLDTAGRPGVKWVDSQQQVVFTPVQLISVSTTEAWVSGLPKHVALISQGQGFVQHGQQVRTRVAGEAQ